MRVARARAAEEEALHRTVTDEHIAMTAILDNTSQVHCNQYMIDLDPKQYDAKVKVVLGLTGAKKISDVSRATALPPAAALRGRV